MTEWSSKEHESSMPSSQCNPLDEPSPLGLRLNKTQSLLELIERRLSEENNASLSVKSSKNLNSPTQKDARRTTTSGANDKLMACGLKSKIEILWSDIIALKATYSDNGPSTLTIVLARAPIFFKETNPQPRKRTIWKPTSDFIGGEASKYRKHFLKCSPGMLNKNYEKLIQCDRCLYILSQQLEIVMDSPYFEAHASTFENPEESRGREFDQMVAAQGYSPSSFQDVELAATTQSPPLTSRQNPNPVTAGQVPDETLSSNSSTILLIFNVQLNKAKLVKDTVICSKEAANN
ncbi:uncharacterized protein LOC111404599 [Olea europaea var. sylvestris]|uniref:uncharacterized protein LOC111404599 n=1 Tax=Olea europaea var. sylvestris TaxID=158386 RepID=UPI000C1CFDF8|nr:uncharacterized protein LOC111404599 [Olea europaea var. sylvestris]